MLGAQNVNAQGPLQPRQVARGQGGDNLFVLSLLHGQARGPIASARVQVGNLQVGVQAFVHFLEAAIAGALQQKAMEMPVVFFVLAALTFGARPAAQTFQQAAEFREFFRPHAFNGLFSGQAFQGTTDIGCFFEVAGSEFGDKGAAAGTNFDEALGG